MNLDLEPELEPKPEPESEPESEVIDTELTENTTTIQVNET
jgi:hypothetical protein